jgi:hypothetical protein
MQKLIENAKREFHQKKNPTWTQLDANKSNETSKHNGTKEESKTPFEGLQAISEKPLAMLNFFTRIHRCRI